MKRRGRSKKKTKGGKVALPHLFKQGPFHLKQGVHLWKGYPLQGLRGPPVSYVLLRGGKRPELRPGPITGSKLGLRDPARSRLHDKSYVENMMSLGD